MNIAPTGVTKPEAGVIATSPATAPEMMPSTVGRLLKTTSMMDHARPAIAVATWVTTNALVASADDAAKREDAAARMGFSAYGVTQNDDPVSQALRGLIDGTASQEHQIALLWQAVEKLSCQLDPNCVPDDAARQERFEAERLNQIIGK